MVYESLIIADFFDDAYPDAPGLHPKDPVQKALDRILVEGWGKVRIRHLMIRVQMDFPNLNFHSFTA